MLDLLYCLLCFALQSLFADGVMLLQLYSAQAAFVNGGATQARSFAKDTASDRPPVSGDGKLLIFLFYVF